MDIAKTVKIALAEDLQGQEDITALLVPESAEAKAYVVAKEAAVICGQMWVNEVFHQVDPEIDIAWQCLDGDLVTPGTIIYNLTGPARSLLTAERTALNFLQTLSAVATTTHKYVELIDATDVKLLDSRKTIPGLRFAEKYAVRCGGGQNHRMGLYDAFLIKENHIRACGSITAAINAARDITTEKPVEVEVENLAGLKEAITADADIVMLDNFSLAELKEAVDINQNQVKLEASGNVNLGTITDIAHTGVDFISVGALTKNIAAIDFSMQFEL